MIKIKWLSLCLPVCLMGLFLPAAPVVFWSPDSVEPGNTVLLYGGGLADVKKISIGRCTDGPIQHPSVETNVSVATQIVPAIQPCENSAKFQMPENFSPGIFEGIAQAASAASRLTILNRPEIWFMQPVQLQPGLDQNQASPGALVQIIGKNFLLPHDLGTARVALRATEGNWLDLTVTNSERFSLWAQLPSNLAEGHYELWIHNGFGGASGWGGPLAVEIKKPDVWPDKIFNVKEFGAQGDGLANDTAAICAALDAAKQNGGGIVLLPWGTYRLTNYFVIPERTVLKGEGRDATVLQWPVDEPKTRAEFSPCAAYGVSRYAVEDLTMIVRKVDTLFTDLSDKSIPNELKPLKSAVSRDVFFRRVSFQHWLMCSHPDRVTELWNVTSNAQGKTIPSQFDGDHATLVRIGAMDNFEFSDCLVQGGQTHFKNLRNARETGNYFANGMGYCYVELAGGAHQMICESNEIRGSSSWGYGAIAMQQVYSAHNRSYNFVRGEREAMTLDISALPTPVTQSNIAWFGLPTKVDGQKLTLMGIKAQPGEFVGLAAMILDGPGAGQYRAITANTPTEFTVDRAWDVPPTTDSTVGLWSLMRHMIIYKCEGYDCSAFAQLYGSFYDFTIDSCRVERNQGLWGQSGWFVRFCYNDVEFANSYHQGIGPHGNNPEGNLPFSFVGLTDGNLRITKFGSSQYGKKLVFVNDVVPHPVPGGRGVIVKNNLLRYNQRVAFPPSAEAKPRDDGKVRFVDVVVDGNRIEHSSAGVQIGPQARNVVLANNQFEDVAEPHLLAKPEQVQLIGADAAK
jgi:hypothetical protein